MSNQYTVADVAKHKDEKEGMWIIVDSGVYDITSEQCQPIINRCATKVPLTCLRLP